ncbi:NUDIX domain-containing protein [Paenibacillus ginsengarvi]|uniref:NUDIX domain-containing protein n=1 Tax=Paenibacillus ginsengarvi TaxID=400777 RepID=A0A3B0CH29_9BACL|nr:NUDIX domain-containing protein [Paenibacillus ginsengarvi]RKN84004.1 NUDIX domain-containing protein [Paenibacillus ginsengarvi]
MSKPLLRAEAIIVRRDGAAVLVQCDRDETFYRFPGGSVEFGETAAEAINRELIEEFELRADIGPLACLNESITQYDGKQRHDCTVLHWGTVDDSRTQDGLQHSERPDIQLVWRTMEQLRKKPVYPEGILDFLTEKVAGAVAHLVVRKSYDD